MADTPHTAASPVTWEQYAAMPDDGNRYEVVGGELRMSPAPKVLHQIVVAQFTAVLTSLVREHGLGIVVCAPTDVILSDTDIVQPDVLFVRKDRLAIIGDQVRGAPDLVVEVLSQSTRKRDMTEKLALYATHGVGHYWIVNPDDRVLIVYRLSGDSYERIAVYQGADQFQSDLFADATLDLSRVWSEL